LELYHRAVEDGHLLPPPSANRLTSPAKSSAGTFPPISPLPTS
jgi:hypothetical protein